MNTRSCSKKTIKLLKKTKISKQKTEWVKNETLVIREKLGKFFQKLKQIQNWYQKMKY